MEGYPIFMEDVNIVVLYMNILNFRLLSLWNSSKLCGIIRRHMLVWEFYVLYDDRLSLSKLPLTNYFTQGCVQPKDLWSTLRNQGNVFSMKRPTLPNSVKLPVLLATWRACLINIRLDPCPQEVWSSIRETVYASCAWNSFPDMRQLMLRNGRDQKWCEI